MQPMPLPDAASRNQAWCGAELQDHSVNYPQTIAVIGAAAARWSPLNRRSSFDPHERGVNRGAGPARRRQLARVLSMPDTQERGWGCRRGRAPEC